MSFQAMNWAVGQVVGDAIGKAVLMALANCADENGRCYPGIERIAHDTEICPRTVIVKLAALEKKGFLTRARRDGRGVRKSNEYRLAMEPSQCASGAHRQKANVHPTSSQCASGALTYKDEPSEIEPSVYRSNGSSSETLPVSRQAPIDRFPDFWSIFPRKVAKGAAERAWAKAIRRAPPETIIAGAKRYAEMRSGQDPGFTAHPATWLNADRWLDDDAPRPNGHDPERLRRDREFEALMRD